MTPLLALVLRARVVPLLVWARVTIALAVAIFLVALGRDLPITLVVFHGSGNPRGLPAGYRRDGWGGCPGYAVVVASMSSSWSSCGVALVAGRGWAWWRCWAAASWCRSAALSLTFRSASVPWAPPSAPMLFALAARTGLGSRDHDGSGATGRSAIPDSKRCSATRRRPWLLRLGLVSGMGTSGWVSSPCVWLYTKEAQPGLGPVGQRRDRGDWRIGAFLAPAVQPAPRIPQASQEPQL